MLRDPLFDRAQAILQADRVAALWRHRWHGHLVWPLVRRLIYEQVAEVSTAPRAAMGGSTTRATRLPWPTGGTWWLLYTSAMTVTERGAWHDAYWGSRPFQGGRARVLVSPNAGASQPLPFATIQGGQSLARWAGRCGWIPGLIPTAEALLVDLDAALPGHGIRVRQVRGALLRHAAMEHWWHQRLERGRPDLILVSDPEEFALVAAARRRGIPVWERQHGIITGWHPGYAFGDIPKDLLPEVLLPDRLLLWGSGWQQVLRDHPWWKHRCAVVGHPEATTIARAREPGLVVYSAGSGDGREVAWLERFVGALPALGAGRLEIRPHPRYRQDLPRLQEALGGHPRVRILPEPEEPVLSHLARAAMHISIGSTCHYLAVSVGCPTVVISGPGWRSAEPLLQTGDAWRGEPEEAVRLLDQVGPSPSALTWCQPEVPDELGELLVTRATSPIHPHDGTPKGGNLGAALA